jgi:twitching motility two-component system response regulator PilG
MQWQHDYLVFRGVAQEGVSRQITQPIEVLIKELEKLRDPETAVNTPSVICSKADEVTYIADAIHLIESCDNNRAEPLLTSVLMGHEENFKGWFWFSRILTNMTAIEIALKKAAFLQPKNPELSEDIKKFTLARKNIKGDFVLRCPFCWMPNDEHDFECAYCKSNFFITPDFFKTIGKAKVEILDKAIERYGNVLQQEQGHVKNPYLRFYLAMAYLNRKYYQEGLDQLHEIAKLLPESNALLMQSRILTDYMNTEGLLRTPVMSPPIVEKTAEVKTGGALKKILIVEDSMVTRKVIARTLVANGYEVFEAKNASEALTDFENRNPNLILLDIILPGKDGYEILAEIRQKPGFEKLPVIMLTSRDSLFDKLKGKVSDANEYLTKPFQPDELLAIVRKYLK